MITSNDIPDLYKRCIARNKDGTFADTAARDQLADLAATFIRDDEEDGEIAEDSIVWCEPDSDGETGWGFTDSCSVGFDDIDLWNHHGRHAPLESLDCAACVALPEGWSLDLRLGWMNEAFAFFQKAGVSKPTHGLTFKYFLPADRATAEVAARVYANLKQKEMGV